jgi:nucleoside-diphosphate-sugar epimerase
MVQVEHQNVLVTGGTGFVGSHLVESLLQRGCTVTCLVRDPARLRWLSGLKVRLVQGDCSLPGSLVSAVKDVSIVFHAAGLTKARRAREYYEVNQLGTRNILEACAGNNPDISKFILVSSLAAAGPSGDGTPVKDTDSPRPVSDYGKSKLLAEEEAMRYQDRFPVVILRPSAVYGPRDADMFELFRWAARGLWVELAGGDRFINPCFVKDLVSALLLAAEKRTASGSIYFVAEDRPYSWSEFREALLSSGGVKARTIKIPYWAAYLMGRASEFGSVFTSRPALTNRQKVREAVQRYWTCDLTKIESELGFRAAFPLEKGLRLTWEWYRKQGWIT